MKSFLFCILTLTFVSSITTHCTKKQANGDIPISESNGNSKNPSLDELKNSMHQADKEIGKMMDQMSMTGFQDKKSFANLLKTFDTSKDKIEKFELCSKILMAKLSYDLRAKLKKDVPQIDANQMKTVKSATEHCQWVSEQVNDFEKTLSDDDFKMIAKNIPNSLVPIQKRLFSTGQKCTAEEFKRLIKMDRALYSDSKIISSIVIMTTIKRQGDLDVYIPRYRQLIEKSQAPEKDFLLQYIDKLAAVEKSPLSTERKQNAIQKAVKAFSQAGIKNIPEFLVTSVSAAPHCFSSISSGVIDLSKKITAQ